MRLVIGIGNPDRGDDAVGLEVASRVRRAALPGVTVRQVDGDPLTLLDALLDARDDGTDVYVVDAVFSGSEPGTVVRLDASRPLGARFQHRGTHTFSLADVIELARALGGLPASVTGYGIEGAAFEFGTGLSPRAESAVKIVTSRFLQDLNPMAKAPPSQDTQP